MSKTKLSHRVRPLAVLVCFSLMFPVGCWSFDVAHQTDEEYSHRVFVELPIATSDNYAVTPFVGATVSEITFWKTDEPRNDFRAGEYGVSFDRTSQRFPLDEEDFSNLKTSVYSYIGAGLSIYNSPDTSLDTVVLMHLRAGTATLSRDVIIGLQARYTFDPAINSASRSHDTNKFQLLITFVPVFLGRFGI